MNMSASTTMTTTTATDYKPKIIEELDVMMRKARNDNERFRALAYDKVIKQLKVYDGPIHTYDDLKDINGIGSGIEQKIREILDTGKLEAAEEIKKEDAVNMSLYDQLLKIHGVGVVKARNLINKDKVTSIADLREKSKSNSKLLNAQQKIGLKYYEELQERIPRSEMKKHEKLILSKLKDAIVVGSYRRELKDSGDIDVLISEKDIASEDLTEIINELKKSGYITDILALGPHKCMAVVQLKSGEVKHRRLDILLTPEDEFITSVLYFTGSQKFNIEMRKKALSLGYTLSEHGLKVKETGDAAKTLPKPPVFKTEKDVFDFLQMKYVEPKDR
jgi:DNA polymerase beta